MLEALGYAYHPALVEGRVNNLVLPDGGKMTLTNFHFTHWDNAHVVEKIDLPDVPARYEALQTRFGLGVDDTKYGFTEAELAAVMAAFDTHPEAGK